MPICPKCKQEHPITDFVPTKSPFHPKGRSLMCICCLERMVDPKDLGAVDRMCRWLDIPFLVDQWTRLWKSGKERTLHLYVKILEENASYQALDWEEANNKWSLAMECGTLEDHIPAINDQWRAQMAKKWPNDSPRTDDDYHYLENFYNDLCTTQNLVSATQRDDAKRLCEIGLLATQKIRAGLDAKNEMAIYHNIVKTEGFEPKNSKSVGDFESVGEVYQYLYERGWKPVWHSEPQDSVDFTMRSVQNFLTRLVKNEATLGDQVEERKKQLEIAERLEKEGAADLSKYDEDEVQVEYEGSEELEQDLGDDADCLN